MPPWCTPCPHIELRQWFVQTVRCQNYRGTLRVPTHMLHILYELPINMHATRITTTTCTSGFMREEEDTADFSVPFQISWLTRNIRCKNHWQHWLLSSGDIVLNSGIPTVRFTRLADHPGSVTNSSHYY